MGWTRFAFSALTLCTPALWRCTSINLSVHHRAAVQRFPFCLKDPQNESITSKSWLSVGLFLWAVSAEHSARCVSILGQSCSKDKNWKVLFLHQRVAATLEVKSVALWIWWTKGLSATCIEMVSMGIAQGEIDTTDLRNITIHLLFLPNHVGKSSNQWRRLYISKWFKKLENYFLGCFLCLYTSLSTFMWSLLHYLVHRCGFWNLTAGSWGINLRLCLSHLIKESERRRTQDDIKMASVNPACRLQTATQVRLWGSSQTLRSVTPCTQETLLHPSDAWGGTAVICRDQRQNNPRPPASSLSHTHQSKR